MKLVLIKITINRSGGIYEGSIGININIIVKIRRIAIAINHVKDK